MWHWRPNLQLRSHNQFWLRLVAFSLIGHLLILGILLFRRHGETLKLTVFSKPRSIEVVLMPLYKHIAKQLPSAGAARSVPASKSKVVLKPKPNNAIKPIAKKAATPIKVAKSKPAKPKKEPLLKLKEQPVKMKAVKPEAKTAKKQAAKVESKSKAKVEPVPAAPIVMSQPVAEVEVGEVVDVAEPILVGRKDLQTLELAQEIETLIAKTWRPPVGFGSEMSCTVELSIDQAGKATKFTITKSAGVLMYDLSVRQVIPQIVFPDQVRNQTLTIVFKP